MTQLRIIAIMSNYFARNCNGISNRESDIMRTTRHSVLEPARVPITAWSDPAAHDRTVYAGLAQVTEHRHMGVDATSGPGLAAPCILEAPGTPGMGFFDNLLPSARSRASLQTRSLRHIG